jgi:hypothetical protein
MAFCSRQRERCRVTREVGAGEQKRLLRQSRSPGLAGIGASRLGICSQVGLDSGFDVDSEERGLV